MNLIPRLVLISATSEGQGMTAMPADLHVQFRLPAPLARKLKGLADLHGTSHNLAARMLLVEALEGTLNQDLLEQIAALHEELAAVRAAQAEHIEELKAFRAEFDETYWRTLDGRG